MMPYGCLAEHPLQPDQYMKVFVQYRQSLPYIMEAYTPDARTMPTQ